MLTCDAGMNLGCQMNGLQCGKEYTFTVSSSDGNCQSPDSEPVLFTTGEFPHQHPPSYLVLFNDASCAMRENLFSNVLDLQNLSQILSQIT